MIKSLRHLLLSLLFLGVILLCALVVIKPGASIFFHKQTMDKWTITPDAGFSYRIKPALSPLIFRLSGVLVYEDGHLLNRLEDNDVVYTGMGAYSLDEMPDGSVYIFFSATDNSDPITNGRVYRLYFPLRIISRTNGLIGLALLLPFLGWFLAFALKDPANRQTLVRAPGGILTVIDRFSDYVSIATRSSYAGWGQRIKANIDHWKRLFTVTLLAAYLYVFMEWLFFVTMPSFMSIMTWAEKVEILLLSGLGFSLLLLALMFLYIIVDILAPVGGFSRITLYLGVVIPTIILSALTLLLIDNFTYTIFKIGIITSQGIWRGIYGLAFIGLNIYICIKLLKLFNLRGRNNPPVKLTNRLFFVPVCILVISAGLALIRLDYKSLTSAYSNGEKPTVNKLPNIILLGSDGLNAENLSAYGYYRDTTPNLRELADKSLVAENAFTNAGSTAGSVISMMTGKLSTQTRVLYLPDILIGENSSQHLPGLLKKAGYTSIEYGSPYYVDAYIYNLQDGFDMVNDRTLKENKLLSVGRKLGYESEAYFLTRLTWRISDRILHIFFICTTENPYEIVTHPVLNISDQNKVDKLLAQLDQSLTPLFVHVHLLGTHGGYYAPPEYNYSLGEDQTQPWMVDFYDDALRAYDGYVGQVINHLKATGEYENTILILFTDHNQQLKVNKRVPLIIHFPGDEYAGRITNPVENIDIAPTILDYLGFQIPDWMSGESLLDGDLAARHLIFSAGTNLTIGGAQNVVLIDSKQVEPPFYQFSFITIIDCQKWYNFDLKKYTWTSGDVAGYVDPCRDEDLHNMAEIKQALAERLAADGFDISSLPEP